MAFDPTGEVGLPQDLTYTDVYTAGSSTHCVAKGFPYDVVIAYNPADTAHKYAAQGFLRGYYHPKRWGYFWRFVWDSTAGGWKPIGVTDGYTRFWVEPRFCGEHGFYIVEYNAASLADGVTAKGWYAPPYGAVVDPFLAKYSSLVNTFRYDTGLPNETGGVWRLSNWAKTYDYDWLTPEVSGWNYDICVPYVRDTLAIGTTATGCGFNQNGHYGSNYKFGEFLNSSEFSSNRELATIGSTGTTYICTQASPVHIWEKV